VLTDHNRLGGKEARQGTDGIIFVKHKLSLTVHSLGGGGRPSLFLKVVGCGSPGTKTNGRTSAVFLSSY